ncbi:hypothetical protein SOV_51340 [Sporomusa ovata DSM 2662]|uniref:Uncharacterized protein n=1 Tax=Sporomusa ovata TaxID=2378 RepID=A0A0U1L2G3_9FIRM|nr:hypothetical protein SOV_2c04030 [Sporomusa ovata DSM 2662]CQR73353.1 hypothetical protein SpAn4DRAFT_2585 [Sporomusa ovata]
MYGRNRLCLYSAQTSFYISKICLNAIIFCFVFILQMILFGFLPLLKDLYIGDILVSAVVFGVTSCIFVWKFVRITNK